jgi:hypothetical protein
VWARFREVGASDQIADLNPQAAVRLSGTPFAPLRACHPARNSEQTVLRNKWLWRSLVLSGLLLFAATVLSYRTSQLVPAEAAIVGTWTTPRQPDGTSTVLQLRPDRTVGIRWLHAAGNDTKDGLPPREGKWWVENETLFVDARLQPHWFERPPWKRTPARATAWRLAIQDGSLILGAQSTNPITLTKVMEAQP